VAISADTLLRGQSVRAMDAQEKLFPHFTSSAIGGSYEQQGKAFLVYPGGA
jgi:hypothetical protein